MANSFNVVTALQTIHEHTHAVRQREAGLWTLL